jgi:hypothetical protein
MIWAKFSPIRFILRSAARRQGFLDPLELMAKLRSLAQPSEVAEPIELLRAGVVFHARGLVNSRVIQNNLDWVWPYWVERQYNPRDVSFMPRAFSVSHINLTHRNWTALGHPDCEEYPLVDPRGLLTPFYDGWSLDAWIIAADGRALFPSKSRDCEQRLELNENPSIITECRAHGLSLTSCARVDIVDGTPVCKLALSALADADAEIVLALRPQNPEGISFLHEVSLNADAMGWCMDGGKTVAFSVPAQRHRVSTYKSGDVVIGMSQREHANSGRCDVGLLTAAASFPLHPHTTGFVDVEVPLTTHGSTALDPGAWRALRSGVCRLQCPERRMVFLYDAAIVSLILHSPADVYPGPYTYKRFWFRDAAFMLHAMLCVGLAARVNRALERFPERQTAQGFFRSQDGEWDSNGEVLWLVQRFKQIVGRMPAGPWPRAIRKAAHWIMRKRLRDSPPSPHAGLLPAGFSAEHLGPNDYYYWDNFWSIAGLRAAQQMTEAQSPSQAQAYAVAANEISVAVERSLHSCRERLGRAAMPASPYRRLDAGAIGSLVAGYPLQLWEPDDARVCDCVEFILQHCFVEGAFFQDMIHSGLNAYLTLHVAQILLRNGDHRYLQLMDAVAQLATSTGQWPEAIHPHTLGGCMGDGQHAWASAEWIMMLRNCFLREEGARLILCSGVPQRWLDAGETMSFGPAPSSFGTVTISVSPIDGGTVEVACDAQWHGTPPRLEVHLPGFHHVVIDPHTTTARLQRSHHGTENL